MEISGPLMAYTLEYGAIFFGVLAYPTSKTKQDRFAGAIICKAIEETLSFGADGPPVLLRLAWLLRDQTTVDGELKRGNKLIIDRLAAVKQAFPELHVHVMDHLGVPRPKEVPTHASAAMLAAISRDLTRKGLPRDGRGPTRQSDGTDFNNMNILTRIWKPSLPVLHIAFALDAEIERYSLLPKNCEPCFVNIMFDQAAPQRLIEVAELIRPFVAEKFGIKPEDQRSVTFVRQDSDRMVQKI
jgi:hypothetical protein